MPSTVDSPPGSYEPDERERTVAWRKSQLERAGYGWSLAYELAVAPHVDLHEACDLVKRCPPWLAARILL